MQNYFLYYSGVHATMVAARARMPTCEDVIFSCTPHIHTTYHAHPHIHICMYICIHTHLYVDFLGVSLTTFVVVNNLYSNIIYCYTRIYRLNGKRF